MFGGILSFHPSLTSILQSLSLQSQNNEVRLNAITLLIAMFPLRQKDQQPIDGKKLLERQLKALSVSFSRLSFHLKLQRFLF